MLTRCQVVGRRGVTANDDAYLRELFAQSRDELLVLPAQLRESLLDLQYRAQRRQITADFPGAAREILVADGADAGLLILDRDPERVHVVDFVVAREHRRRGIASGALREVIDEAGQRAVTLSVWSGNVVARSLYERFGFAIPNKSEITEGYLYMERRPNR
jgi:ribosomal protein S18 acetylase RimI-like enzyme